MSILLSLIEVNTNSMDDFIFQTDFFFKDLGTAMPINKKMIIICYINHSIQLKTVDIMDLRK